MLSKFPCAGTPIGLSDIFEGIKREIKSNDSIKNFEDDLRRILGVKEVFTIGSGTAAFYVALEVLKKMSAKKEVILPAYTAPVLKLPIERAGLKAVLCEVSLETFNLDPSMLEEALTEDTLCVVPVHLFGIPSEMDQIKTIAMGKGIYIIEDNAQSLGSKIKGRLTGGGGDIGILSFQRGKNLSTYTGGALVTDSEVIGDLIRKEFKGFGSEETAKKLPVFIKALIVSLVVRPLIYGALHPVLSPFKSRELHHDFEVKGYTPFQAGLGHSLLKSLEKFSLLRNRNGMKLLRELSGTKGYILPNPSEDSFVAFSQFPIIVEDRDRIEGLIKGLWHEGIEATRMYLKPMHRIFGFGYEQYPDPFPKATFLAERLLLLPTHPLINDQAIDRMVRVLKEAG